MQEERAAGKPLTTLLHLQYVRQAPCELLREIVQSCICYMDKENLINSLDYAELSPSSVVGQSVKEELNANESDDVFAQHKSNKKFEINVKSEKMKKPVTETVVPSGSGLKDGYREHKAEIESVVKADASAQVVIDTGSQDCEITGMSVNTESGEAKNISADVIAQIDFEIAQSLKAAFSNIGDFGLNKTFKQKGRSRNNYPDINSLKLDKNLQKVKTSNIRRRSADEVKQTDIADKQISEITSLIEKNPVTVLKKMTVLSKMLQQKPLSVSINEKPQQKTNPGCVSDCLNAKHYENGRADDTHAVTEDLPDIVKEETDKEEKQEDDGVWICFICAKSFADQSKLMVHQELCEGEPSNTDSELLKPVLPVSSNQQASTSEGRPLNKCNKPPVPTLLRKVGSSLKSLPLGLPTKTREVKRHRKLEDIYIPPSRNIYFESLGLISTPSVEAISKSPKKNVFDDDCQIIDLTVEDTPQAVPMTPRTRSMLSQLSRDDSNGRRRQLSFSQTTQQLGVVKELSVEKELSEDSECNEELLQNKKVPSKSAILGIPLTSPLGQRLKKHWKYENKVPIVDNIEMYCKTDAGSLISLNKKEKKNPMVEKLRNRPPPQCTFRFTKKYMNKWCHLYKFNKSDKREFEKRLKFGLDRDSRLRLKKMKRCKVVLAKISKKDIKFWTTPRPKVVQKRVLPETALLHQLNRQYRLSQIQYAMSSKAVRPMHGNLYNQLVQPVRVAGPTPQLLVRTVPMGGQGMRLQVLPVQQTQNLALFPNTKSNLVQDTQRETTGSHKRKQVFNNVKEDDSMVICLSSDEEEEIVIKPLPKQHCAMCRVYKDECKVHGKRRIGPASFMRQQSRNMENSGSAVADRKSNAPVNIFPVKSVKTGQPVQYTNTASARIFGPSSTQNVIPAKHVSSIPQLTLMAETSSEIPPVSASQDTSQTGQIKTEVGLHENVQNETQPTDSDYMDYEVICIDSDENDD